MLEVPLMGPWDLRSPSIGTLEVPLQVPARSALYTCRVPRAAAAAKEIDPYEAACFALELRLECKDDFLIRGCLSIIQRFQGGKLKENYNHGDKLAE